MECYWSYSKVYYYKKLSLSINHIFITLNDSSYVRDGLEKYLALISPGNRICH